MAADDYVGRSALFLVLFTLKFSVYALHPSTRGRHQRGGEPLLMDTEGAGTQSERRRPPFYSYHKLKTGTLLVSVASEPGVLRGLRVSQTYLT